MVHVNTNEPLNDKSDVVFITSEQQLKHLSIDADVLGQIQVTGNSCYIIIIGETDYNVRYVVSIIITSNN